MFKRAANAYGKPNERNTGVVIVHTNGNEAAAKFEGKAAIDSPDGLLFTCTINENKLIGDAEARAVMFAGENVADLRNPMPEDVNSPFFDQEERSLVVTALDAFASGQKTLTLPGSYLVWNKAWPTEGISKKVDDSIEDFILKEELLHE
jgi:hypothetical protein